MYHYDEDFYHEPSEFEIQVDEFKKSLLQSVKQEFIEEMDQLKLENQELQSIKQNFEKIKSEYKEKERQLERERNGLINQVRRERLSALMKDFEVIMYQAYTRKERPPKCNQCDKDRRIKYKTPSGKDAYEDCTCKQGKTVYFPKDYICSEFKINSQRNGMAAFYRVNQERDYDYYSYDSSIYAETIFNNMMDYEGLNSYRTFFKSKEECQEYCDYLNAKETEE
ncbi:hypothetical protein [Priestia megaterium]|uniref:hypothetical protein n=1 Tax=Priestia megaterium TaxID=1404 RepID=UPI0030084A4F